MNDALAIRVSAGVMAAVAAGFGGPAPFVAASLLRTGKLPIFMGMFPMYGGPLLGRCSQELFTVALGLFTAMSAMELFAAALLWQGHRLGGIITAGLLPFEVAFWFAFALPIPPLLGAARLFLLWLGWSALR